MAVESRGTLSRERAGELVRAWAGGRPGPLGSVLGRVTAVDQVGATQRVEALKRRSIKREATGRAVGMKPAGGIRTAREAVQYLVVLYETLGPRWMTPDRFRFGASSLLNDILMQIEKERTGRYQRPDDFTLD